MVITNFKFPFIICNDVIIHHPFDLQFLLRTLTFINTEDEPTSVVRSLIIAVGNQMEMQSCSLVISVLLINDNPPVVDLSGLSSPSINHSVSLNFSFFERASVMIASRDATITDVDEDSRIVSLDVVLTPGRPGDRIYLSQRVGCPRTRAPVCR